MNLPAHSRAGNFNSWDRLPFLTTSTGAASTDVLPTRMTSNFVISNYASTWPLDHDDGSCFYHDTRNFLVWAGAKNFLGQYLLRPIYMEYLYVEFVCKCIYVYFTYILDGARTC